MSDVRPFAALRFAREPGPRLAPPWDVIAPADREQLASESENIVHLTLPPGEEGERDYASARTTLERWRSDAVLVRDPRPRLYLLSERVGDGRVRRGLIALLRIAEYDERVVLPHERTMPKARHDRLLLTREVEANLEPLFFLYEDPDQELESVLQRAGSGEQLAACPGPDGTGLELRAIDSPELIASVSQFFVSRPVVIADGHHRYDTMLRYRNERRAAGETDPDSPQSFVLAYLTNAFDPGSEVRAIHRLVRGDLASAEAVLRDCGFALETPSSVAPADLITSLASRRLESHAFVFLYGDATVMASRPRGDVLDVEVLHSELLPALGGEPSFDADPERVAALARAGQVPLAILQNPLSPEELFRVVRAGKLLPQKSTYFAPKIPSGLLLRDFAG